MCNTDHKSLEQLSEGQKSGDYETVKSGGLGKWRAMIVKKPGFRLDSRRCLLGRIIPKVRGKKAVGQKSVMIMKCYLLFSTQMEESLSQAVSRNTQSRRSVEDGICLVVILEAGPD